MAEGDTIRVIIVDDVRETRDNIRKLLQFESDIEVAGVATTGREGIQLARDVTPDVVLMDINMPDMDGITATENILKEIPHIQIVILSVQGDPNYMRRAMLAGARDFLTKPPMVDELIAAIRRAGRMAHEEKQKVEDRYPSDTGGLAGRADFARQAASYGKVIVVYSPKGGVGCTTLATNLAVTLHNDETPTVVVDGNLQFGDLTIVLNERGKNSIVDLAPRADELDAEIVEEVLITHRATGVKILAAPQRPEHAENVSGDQFGKILAHLRRMYSYVIVDAESALSDIVLSAFDASSMVILVANQDIPSINDARLFLDLTDVIGIDRDRILFVLNKYDKRIAITPESIGENLRKDISVIIPADERAVLPSVNRGSPFVMSDKKRPIARAVLTLAETVRHQLVEFEDAHEVPNQVS
ncbi:MAG: response regulator [Chloroflexi bacterium]|nr:response regulator [Chloroflexota bacterium]MBL7163366.1 response regulator [Anaerolineales bacterium]